MIHNFSKAFLVMMAASIPAVPMLGARESSIQTTNVSKTQSVNLNVQKAPLVNILKDIERQTGCRFSYDPKKITPIKGVSIKIQGGSLESTLVQLQKATGFVYTSMPGGVVVISSQKQSPQSVSSTNSKNSTPGKISGRVVDDKGEPLIGATIMIAGTKKGVATDVDGNFTIDADKHDTLTITYVGYKRKEIKGAAGDNLSIVMKEDANVLDEMVVVGYGTMKKADLTGAVANIGGTKVEEMHATSISQALQGSMPGLQVSRNSGLPGATATVRVRGITSIGDSSPLVIVDGVPDTMEAVNSADIESISVLKDAASASIYGARAAAGVILITTKKAKEGKAKVEYQGSYGVIQSTSVPKAVGALDYMKLYNELAWNDMGNPEDGRYPIYSEEFMDSYLANHAANPDAYPITDWRALMVRNTAPTTKHDFKISYGNKISKSNVSIGYENTEALYHGRNYQRITARTNNSFKFSNWLTFGADSYFRRGVTNQPQNNPLAATLYMSPLDAAIWSNGRFAEGHGTDNPYAVLLEGGRNTRTTDRLGTKLSFTITPIDGLSINGVYSPGVLYTRGKSYVKQVKYYNADNADIPAGYIKSNSLNSLTENRDYETWETKQLFLNYNKTFAEAHRTDLMLGYEDYTYTTNTLTAGSDNMELADYFYLVNANLNSLNVDGTESQNAYRSFFGRINYAYKGRYLAQLNVRADQSSRFARKFRTGFFPSASLGWVITEENFLRDLSPAGLSYLKLRGSYGTLGNERIGNYPWQANMTFAHPTMVDTQGNAVGSLSSAQRDYNIPNITWETTYTWNAGVDATFFNSRLSTTFDWYRKHTKDMLLAVQLPLFMGYDNPKQNAGKMTTHGWDLQINWNDAIGDFNYSVGFNISDYRSIMGTMGGREMESGGTITREGTEYMAWYGFKSNGLYQNLEDLANSAVVNANTAPGDIKYMDVNGAAGMPDGQVSAQYDRVILGSSQPRLIYGGQLSASWKGIDFSAAFNGVGHQDQMLSRAMLYQRHAAGWIQFTGEMIGTCWSADNTTEQNLAAKYPRLTDAIASNNGLVSDFWMINGGYFRCKNIQLGYSFPKNLIKKIPLSNLRVFASVSDPFCFHNYPQGWDPESTDTGSSYIARTWNFGLNVSF